MKPLMIVLQISIFFSVNNVMALSPQAIEGKLLYSSSCNVCHDQALDPPLGPPMWSVQRRYKMATLDDEDFVESMVDFVKAPSPDKVKHDVAYQKMGLMPHLSLADDTLKKIVIYILEESFPAPCKHWEIGAKLAEEKGDVDHAEKDRRQLQRFCQ